MIHGFRVLRSVLFTRDDNFFLHLQSRDVINSNDEIHSSSSGLTQTNFESAAQKFEGKEEAVTRYTTMLNLSRFYKH